MLVASRVLKLLCCKCLFNRIKVNLAEIQLKKNVQKMHFWQKVPGVNGLTIWCLLELLNYQPQIKICV